MASGSDLLLLKERQSPTALCALESNMLFAHPVPHYIIVSESLPALADLGGMTE